jgi:arylsulfatase A-like enzyme
MRTFEGILRLAVRGGLWSLSCSRRSTQTRPLLQAVLIAGALLLFSCGGDDAPHVWRLHEDGRFRFVRKGPPAVAEILRSGGLRTSVATLTNGGRIMTGSGTLSVREDTLLAGVLIENPAEMLRIAAGIELDLSPRGAGHETTPVSRAGVFEDGAARWQPLSVVPGQYGWSARLLLRPGSTAPDLTWPKMALLWARQASPGLASASSSTGAGHDTRPAFLMSEGTEVVCSLPEGDSWRLELAVSHPSAPNGMGKVRLLLEHDTKERPLANLAARGMQWSDTLLALPVLPSGGRIRFSCTSGEVFVGAPLLAGSSRAAARSQPPNILLVSLDTVRADHLAPWGNEELAPGLGRFARRAVVFERAMCQAPVTDASHHSIFTGLQVPRHGGERPFVLPEQIPTLAELLSNQGYRTAGFTDNNLVSAAFGFARGFDRYWEHGAPYGDKDHLEEILARCKGWLAEIGVNQPWFTFVHTYQAHSPYVNHEEPALPPVSVSPAREPTAVESLPEHIETPGDSRSRSGAELLDLAKRNYASEVRCLDALTTRFLQNLEDEGHLDNTLVIILSDHGEGFLEHGLMAHDNSLFSELIHVPLFLRLPQDQYAGTRVREVVQTVDLLPTLLEYAGLPPPREIDGVSLLDACRSGRAVSQAAISTDKEYYSVTLWPHKLIVSRTGGRSALYRVDVDPGESESLLEQATPALIDSLKAPLIDLLSKAHDGYLVILARPGQSAAMVVVGGMPTAELPVLFAAERDDVRPTRQGLVLGLTPSPLGDVVVLAPGQEPPTAWIDPQHPRVLREGATTLGPFGVEVRRCRGIPPARLRSGQAAVPADLEARLRALGYVN